MITDILQSTLSPTQQRGEPKLKGGIVHDFITNASGDRFRIEIKYYLVGDVATIESSEITGKHEIPSAYLWAMEQDLVEQTEGHSLIFQK